MKEIVQMLSEQLEYVSHKIREDVITINAKSKNTQAKCPFCGEMSDRVHSHYKRRLQDLPIQGKKAKLLIDRKKYFCDNEECRHGTFVEQFEFFEGKATKTRRLQEEILRVSLTQSSTSAARYLRASVADVGKSTICNLLKKGREKEC
jgi:transposase